MLRILAVVIGVPVQVALYYYLWRRLVANTELAQPWRRRLTAGIIILGLSVPITLLAARFISAEIGQTVGWPVFFWIAISGIMTTLFGLFDLARLSRWGARAIAGRPDEPDDPRRRAFVSRILGGGAALGAMTMAGHGAYQALRTPGIVEVPIELSRLPPALDGFRIIQLTDIHIGNTIGRGFVQDVVDRANAADADLIAITGDLVDGSVANLADAAAPLADLKSRHGVYFVTGNHEYYSGADAWIEHIRGLGIQVLRNERVEIGDGSASFDLAGVDDHGAHFWNGHGADMARAAAGRDPLRELIVLAHQPRQVHESARHGAGLQLSGHTHGGQIWPWHYLAMAQQGGLLAGHSLHGDTQLYVSRGTGYWGPPVRVFAPAEITRVVLRAKRTA